MKNNKKGFTLIELLTVIAIIGILAGIIIPSVGGVRKAAKKTKTKAMYSQWASAIELFRQDYGYYPSFEFPQAEDGDFYNLLTGDPTSTLNTKNIRYFSFADDSIAEDSAFGVTDGQIIDGFGNPNIGMAVDSDRNGVIEEDELNGAPGGSSEIRQSVIFWSDNTSNTADFEEVLSW
tara:strand:- start:18261 stop:18791 length:531 start_codon:yes stop_codon:yes gene_type:complete